MDRHEAVSREQRALENLEAWAARGDAWVRATAAQKTRELVPGHAELRTPFPLSVRLETLKQIRELYGLEVAS